MCETGHNNLTFITVEQKIAWEYLEVCIRYRNFALKQPILSIFEHFLGIEKFKKTNFAANHCEYV